MSDPITRWGTAAQIVLICKPTNRTKWSVVSNPRKDYAYEASVMILANVFSEYMAYVNAGIEYRFIHQEDLSKYDI